MVRSGNTTILLDAGIKLGEVEEHPTLPDALLKHIDAVFVTHAHLDHSGYLPHIFSAGYEGKVYATKPTLELINVLISDYMHISNPQNVSTEGLARMRKSYEIVEFGETVRIKDISVTPMFAGHILGSAMLYVSDGKHTLLYTGDINLSKTRLLDGADTKNLTAETLITESTYGARTDIMPAESTTAKKMLVDIKETLIRGNKVIIPSFAVGRAQEVLLLLDDFMNSGTLPKVPIYIDGMINKAMRIHRHNVIYCRKELQRKILMSDTDPFKSSNFFPVETRQARSKAASEDGASIIVTTSGMLTGGPIVYYLRRLAGNPSNKLILVGYQANGTPGNALQSGATTLRFEHATVAIKLEIRSYHLSAHVDRPHLEAMIRSVKTLKNVFIIHGEKNKAEELSSDIQKNFRVIVPKLGEEYDV
jgi:hypothetical protein